MAKAKKKATKSKTKSKAKPRPKKRAAPKAKAMSQDQMMALWQKAATPAEGHRRLQAMEGSFRAKTTFTMSPGDPPQVSDAVSEHRFVLGGRYLEQL